MTDIYCLISEYMHVVSPLESHVIVDSQNEHESKEDASSTNKMPNIMVIIEI